MSCTGVLLATRERELVKRLRDKLGADGLQVGSVTCHREYHCNDALTRRRSRAWSHWGNSTRIPWSMPRASRIVGWATWTLEAPWPVRASRISVTEAGLPSARRTSQNPETQVRLSLTLNTPLSRTYVCCWLAPCDRLDQGHAHLEPLAWRHEHCWSSRAGVGS